MKYQNERDKLLNEIEKFKNHIILLTESNKELMEELENVMNADDKVRNILDRENQIKKIIIIKILIIMFMFLKK